MYTKQAASLLTQQFWTAFGLYMAPVLSAEGEKINWINYKTGQKDTRFVMRAENGSAKISIIISHMDKGLQKLYFDKFVSFKKIFHQIIGEEWQWDLHTNDQQGKTISSVYFSLDNVNVLNKDDWPEIISFLKARIIALDIFWSEYKYAFDAFLPSANDPDSVAR